MTDKELRACYVQACDAKGYIPDEGQFRVWKQVLGYFEAADLTAAITKHYETSLALPMPAELRAITHELHTRREAKSSERRYLVVFLCPVCGVRRSGYLTIGDREPRFCGSNNGPMLPVDAPPGTRRLMLPVGVVCGTEMKIERDERAGWAA